MPKAVNVGIEPLTTFFTGQTTTSGTATILYATSTRVAISAVIVKAHSGNTNDVYVGISSVATTDGYVLHPHDSVAIDLDNRITPVYIISPGTAQRVSYLAVA